MLSGLFKAKSKPMLSRFESTDAFKQPVIIINKLRDKQNELKKSADTAGPGSIDYSKHLVIVDLMQQIDNAIAEFNGIQTTSTSDETTDIIQTTRKISQIISSVRRTEEKTLMTSRNKQREHISNAVYYSTFGTTFMAGSALSIGTLGKLATLFYIAPTVSKSIHEATGLNDLSPTSIRLLDELSIVLDYINANLTIESFEKGEAKESEVEDFLCPITQEIIKNPVVCTLDGHAYEKAAIEKWLNDKRKSPLNRMEIPPGKSTKDVLVAHFNYASLLEKFHREHPTKQNTKATP